MTYQVQATVNYPEAKEIETPASIYESKWHVHQWINKLLDTEPDATSFVIIVIKS